jgi:hypothetical protein
VAVCRRVQTHERMMGRRRIAALGCACRCSACSRCSGCKPRETANRRASALATLNRPRSRRPDSPRFGSRTAGEHAGAAIAFRTYRPVTPSASASAAGARGRRLRRARADSPSPGRNRPGTIGARAWRSVTPGSDERGPVGTSGTAPFHFTPLANTRCARSESLRRWPSSG